MLSAGQYRDVGASGVTARTVESAGTASRLGSEPQAWRLGRPKHADRRNKIPCLRIGAMDIPGNESFPPLQTLLQGRKRVFSDHQSRILVSHVHEHARCFYLCISMMAEAGIMFVLRCAMIHSDPETMRVTTSRPKASASTLLVLSGPVPICRKNIKCTPI
jgi:hypothetical protein